MEAHGWHPSIDRGGWKRRVRARKLCGEDQTCCCIAGIVRGRMLLYRDSIITGRRVNTEVEAMYTITLGYSWSREWAMNCHARLRRLRHELQACKALRAGQKGRCGEANMLLRYVQAKMRTGLNGVVCTVTVSLSLVPLLIAKAQPTASAYVMASVFHSSQALNYHATKRRAVQVY